METVDMDGNVFNLNTGAYSYTVYRCFWTMCDAFLGGKYNMKMIMTWEMKTR